MSVTVLYIHMVTYVCTVYVYVCDVRAHLRGLCVCVCMDNKGTQPGHGLCVCAWIIKALRSWVVCVCMDNKGTQVVGLHVCACMDNKGTQVMGVGLLHLFLLLQLLTRGYGRPVGLLKDGSSLLPRSSAMATSWFSYQLSCGCPFLFRSKAVKCAPSNPLEEGKGKGWWRDGWHPSITTPHPRTLILVSNTDTTTSLSTIHL